MVRSEVPHEKEIVFLSAAQSKRECYLEGWENGYDTGCEDERREIAKDGLVIRWSDDEIYTWRPVPGHWEHTPHRWAGALNEQGE